MPVPIRKMWFLAYRKDFFMSEFKKHFRIYFKSGHPAYIVDEEGDYYYFHRVTSSPKSGTQKLED